MRKLSVVLWSLLFLLSGEALYAQFDPPADSIDNMIIYTNERSGHILAHSHGFGLGYRSGKNINAMRTRVLSFEAVTMRSGKEIKTINPYWDNSKRYVYGKLNEVVVVRAGWSNKLLLNRKPYFGGVELRWFYEGGLSLAVEKPYYLYVVKILNATANGIEYEIITSRFNADSSSIDDIYGRAPFTKGLNELRFVPGIYGKLGLNFEFGSVRTAMRAAEMGVSLDYFPQTVDIMDDKSNKTLFLNFYISYAFGRRFNKY